MEKTGAAGQEKREADVREGTLIARYRWPRRVSHPVGPPWVTGSTLYGTTRDSLDIWRAARVRFTRIP